MFLEQKLIFKYSLLLRMNGFLSNDFIGATGLYPIYDYIDDTSNVISNRITNTSNELADNNKWVNYDDYLQYKNIQVHNQEVRVLHTLTKVPLLVAGIGSSSINSEFKASASSVNSYFNTAYPYKAFDGDLNTYYSGSFLYDRTTGNILDFLPEITITDVNGVLYYGEWLGRDIGTNVIIKKFIIKKVQPAPASRSTPAKMRPPEPPSSESDFHKFW